MPDVRMPDGTIVKNVPPGTTQSELMRRLGKARMPSMGPTDMSAQEIEAAARQQVAESANAPQGGFLERMNARFAPGELAPALGVGAAMMAPGPGWLALLAGSGLAAGTTAMGEAAKQDIRGDIDPAMALKAGAESGIANLAGGAALKTLGAAAKAAFSSPLDDAGKAAASFARQQGAPFPLSSAAPSSSAGRIQRVATRILLPGEIRTQVDANRVTQFLNNRVSTIVDNASPVDEAAAKGQQYLRQVFEPGETVYTQTFQKLRATVGDDTAVPLTNTKAAIEGVSNALKERGEMKAVFNRLRNIQKGGATQQTVSQLDELYSGILKDIGRNANARREGNVVLNAIAKDIDGVAKDFGVSFTDDIAQAKGVRDQFRELRNIPQLERLAKDFGDKGGTLGSRQWMAEMFANPNGKALAELRTRNPQLYHELADSWLASNINRFSKPVKDGIGRALDGPAFRSWFQQNEANLKVVLGGPQTKALDNFSLYAKHMTGAVERASTGGGKFSDPMFMMARGGGELAGIATQPFVMIPGEAASYVLAKGLSDPSSALFKAFTEGFSPATRSFVVKSGQLAGQGAASRE
jgi:hypothetical protein